MAEKPWLKKSYTLIIVPHAEAKFRKVKLPYWMMMLGASLTAAIFTVLIVFLVHYWLMLDDVSRFSSLVTDNQRLSKENARYEQITADIHHRPEVISDKTKVLSNIAGVKPVETRGMGDIGGDRYNNEVLDRDLPMDNMKINDISSTLDKVEKSFNELNETLDLTPSIWPLISTEQGRITSSLGYRRDPFTGKRTYHSGIDISAELGTPIIAPANGVVMKAQKIGGLGNLLEIDHGLKFITRYGHLTKFNVKKHDNVKRGDIIGYLGNTGRSTGPHLHYEVIYNGKEVNPKDYILNYNKIIPMWDFKVVNK